MYINLFIKAFFAVPQYNLRSSKSAILLHHPVDSLLFLFLIRCSVVPLWGFDHIMVDKIVALHIFLSNLNERIALCTLAPHTCKCTLFSWAAVGLCYMRKLDFFITIRKVCSREKVKAKVNSHCIGYFLKSFLDFGCFPVLFWKYYLPCLPSVPLLPVYLLLVSPGPR